jgi:Derlin-2/3
MAAPAEEWYSNMPPITKIFATSCVATTLAIHLDLVSPLAIYLNFDAVLARGQWWRLVSNFFFFDYISLNFIFQMFFLIRHSRMLEEGSFHGRRGDFVFLWLWAATALLLLDASFYFAADYSDWIPSKILVLGPSLSFVILYVWSRRNPSVMMSFFGVFTFTAPYLPWVILGFGTFLGQSPLVDLLGIIVGHLYYFLEDVYPAQTGIRLLRTPRWFVSLVDRVSAAISGIAPPPPGNDRRAAWGAGVQLDPLGPGQDLHQE